MKKPLTLVTGVDPDAMSSAVLSLALDLPHAAVVRHRIDLERSVLVRMVSDLTGIVEHQEIDLAHACVPCAVRQDVVPTIERVARDPRWGSVLVQLPVAAEADQVCCTLAQERNIVRALRVNSVVAAVDGPRLEDDLLGDDLLADHGLATSEEDRRGVGEVLADLVEYADVVAVTGGSTTVGTELVRALARPDVRVVDGTERLDATVATEQLHHLGRTREWASQLRDLPLGELDLTAVWRVDLRSERGFHPERLMAGLDRLGTGRHRSKGCFWLPTRPGNALEWAGSGGQVSVGTASGWGQVAPHTRLVLTGVGNAPTHLEPAFASMLLQPGETYRRTSYEDGFEPWLGPIRDIA